MSSTIKTQVLLALVDALATASGLVTVSRFPPTGVNLETVPTPAAYIHEATPETRESNNRFARGILELDIMVFIALQSGDADNGNLTFLDQADDIQGQIHNILHQTGYPGLTGLVLKVEERQVEKIIPNDQWGVLVYTVEVTYQHLTGDAFSRS